MSYRSGLLNFCGTEIKTHFDIEEPDGKTCFKNFENGIYTKDEFFEGIKTCHPNVLKGVIVGKKSWGLWRNEWSDGISECLFTLDEIIEQFTNENIVIPESLLNDLKNTIKRKKMNKYKEFIKNEKISTHRILE
jgi:hypothetical protein